MGGKPTTVYPGVTTTNGRTFTARVSNGQGSTYLGTFDTATEARVAVLVERARRAQAKTEELLRQIDAIRSGQSNV